MNYMEAEADGKWDEGRDSASWKARLRMLRSWHPHNPHGAGATSPGVRIIKSKTGSSSFGTVNDDRRNSTSLSEATLHFNLQAIKLTFIAFAA